jgi:hypothetical protein
MDWRQARDATLSDWRRIRASIGEADPIELLTDVNAVCALCEKADEEPPEGKSRCERCLVARQFGGCSQLNGLMSEKIAEHDWEGLTALVDEFLHELETVDLDDADPA